MKKKLLFVIPSLDAGGGEKALVNLLNTINYNQYEVTLLLFKKQGLFLNLVPNQVEIKNIEGNYIHFTKSLFPSVFYFLSKTNFKLIAHRKFYFFKRFFIKSNPIFEQKSWVNISKSIPFNNEEYDVAISFLEKASMYYVVDKVKAKQKMGWIHTNYSSSGLNPKFDANYFSKINNIITVSEECKINLTQNFPQFSDKISIIHNIVSSELVNKLANETIADNRFKISENSIITVARLSHEKGIDIAVNACKVLVSNNPILKWYVIGEGNQRTALEKQIAEHNLQNNFILLGLKQNPYPFVKAANIYVQPSRYEGKSIAIDEAKFLNKPIVVTNFTTAKDQIENNINGIISNSDFEILAKDIEKILNNKELQNKLSLQLSKNQEDTSQIELEKFYKLIKDFTEIHKEYPEIHKA